MAACRSDKSHVAGRPFRMLSTAAGLWMAVPASWPPAPGQSPLVSFPAALSVVGMNALGM